MQHVQTKTTSSLLMEQSMLPPFAALYADIRGAKVCVRLVVQTGREGAFPTALAFILEKIVDHARL
jgi:hypothetical protein